MIDEPQSIDNDRVAGDIITTGEIKESTGVAIGQGAVASVKNFFLNIPKYLTAFIISGIVLTVISVIFVAYNTSLASRILTAPTPTMTVTPSATPIPTSTPTPLPFEPADQGETLIVIAKFHVTEGNIDTDIQNEIRRAIEQTADKLDFSNLRVEVEPTSLEADARADAEMLGQKYGASMVIWGADTGVRLTVNYLNLKEPTYKTADIQIIEKERTQIANPDAYARFVTENLPSQLTFLSFLAVGQSYYAEENYTNAVMTIERAISVLNSEKDPVSGLPDAYFQLGWLYQVFYSNQDLKKAIIDYNKAININPQHKLAYNNRGVAYASQGEYDLANIDFTKAIELDSEYALGYYNRGITYNDQKKYELAVTDFTQAIDLNPEYAKAYVGRGVIYYQQKEYDLAIADYTRAIDFSPEFTLAYYNRGNAFYYQGKYELAIDDFNKAIDLNPQFTSAYNNLCWLGSLIGQATNVLKHCEQAVQLASPSERPRYSDARGLARALTGDYQGAIDDFTVFIDWTKENGYYESYGAKRAKWILELEKGQSPFDTQTLEELKNE